MDNKDENAKNPAFQVRRKMTRAKTPAKQHQHKDAKKRVDVATLEKSVATSGNDPKDPGPVAVGEASG